MGCESQLFTAVQEVNDPLVVANFTFVLALNLIIAVQMYMYWGHTASQEGAAKVCDEMLLSAAKVYDREKADIVVQPQSHLLQQVHERSQSAVYRHKWVCKVD